MDAGGPNLGFGVDKMKEGVLALAAHILKL